MADPDGFLVHLGGGLYMDETGVLKHGPELTKPVYTLPGGDLTSTTDSIQKALTGLKKALPDADDPKSIKKLTDLGVPINFVNILCKVGMVAGTVATAFTVIGIVIVVLSFLLDIVTKGPDPLEVLITRRTEELKQFSKSIATQLELGAFRDSRSVIDTAVALVNSYKVALVRQPAPDPAVLATRYDDMSDALPQAEAAVRALLDSSTYLAVFDPGEYAQVWGPLQNILHIQRSDGTLPSARMPATGTLAFDHRVMVPMVSYAVSSYLTIIRAITPEYRTTMVYSGQLFEFATAIDRMAANMRNELLARTVYTPDHFSFVRELTAGEVNPFSMTIRPNNTRWPVGAMDLRNHNDAFFGPGFSAGALQFSDPKYGQKGLINLRWIPPASLTRIDRDHPTINEANGQEVPGTITSYVITNRVECAAAANAQAEEDYVSLLYSSGYFSLAHLAATLRQEATCPERSQTVAGALSVLRETESTSAVTVASRDFADVGVITADATRSVDVVNASARITTQALGRPEMVQYRVVLRTLPDRDQLSWGVDDYSHYFATRYDVNTHRNVPNAKQLHVFTYQEADHVVLVDWSTSTALPRATDTTVVTLDAFTFDWWIPFDDSLVKRAVDQPVVRDQLVTTTAEMSVLRGLGWNPAAMQMFTRDAAGSRPGLQSTRVDTEYTPYKDLLSLVDGSVEPDGHHRNWKRTEVAVEYSLDWTADHLDVRLKGRPIDRNYALYLVVEERLGDGQVLHTSWRVPMYGQFTSVPQSFFDKEFAANNRALAGLVALATERPELVPVPTDPGIAWVPSQEIDLTTAGSPTSFEAVLNLVEREHPSLLRQAIRNLPR